MLAHCSIPRFRFPVYRFIRQPHPVRSNSGIEISGLVENRPRSTQKIMTSRKRVRLPVHSVFPLSRIPSNGTQILRAAESRTMNSTRHRSPVRTRSPAKSIHPTAYSDMFIRTNLTTDYSIILQYEERINKNLRPQDLLIDENM